MAIMQNIKSGYTTENNGTVVVLSPKALNHSNSTAFDTNHTIVPNVNTQGGMTYLNNNFDGYFDNPRYYSGDTAS